MGKEIERKFLVNGDHWKQEGTGKLYRQGYLSSEPERTVRVRTVEDMAYLTIKGKTAGASRSEYEYAIPHKDALSMLDELCEQPIIEKIRYEVLYEGLLWEIDEFRGENLGLIVAEVELTDENQTVSVPPWVGQEVTTEAKYYNANLFKYPFTRWS